LNSPLMRNQAQRGEEERTSGKGPDPDRFAGEPDDPDELDRFLRQLKQKFKLEHRRYRSDAAKITYASMLMKGKAGKWLDAYEKRAEWAEKTDGEDHAFAQWDTFENALRASFGNRQTRTNAVKEWNLLRHKSSIDDFLDELTRLMWITGYDDATVKDKIIFSLNEEVGKEWAKTTPKPDGINDQIAMLREIGHRLEDWYRIRGKKPQDEKKQKSGGEQKQPDQKTSGTGKSKQAKKAEKKKKPEVEWKDKKVELKGIPQNLLDERRDSKVCLKCGKGPHAWFECRHDKPVTVKVASAKATKKRKSDSEDTGVTKKAKVASTAKENSAEVASGRIIELPDDVASDFELEIDQWEA
jgi:hypothetical protein